MSFDFDQAIASLGIRLERQRHGQYVAADDPDRSKQTVRQSVTREEAVYLSQWAEGRRVLEIGTGLGISTVALASTAKSVDTVDPNPWVLSALTFPPHVRQHARFDDVRGPFDLAFVDGEHDADSVRRDIRDCLSVLEADGFIAFHDAHQEGVKAAMAEIKWRSRFNTKSLGHLSLCQRPE